jgi:hypothetical protein
MQKEIEEKMQRLCHRSFCMLLVVILLVVAHYEFSTDFGI